MLRRLLFLFVSALLGAGCESMVTDFDPGVRETTPKLVVHAGLDIADSTFYVELAKTTPLSGVQVEDMEPFEDRQLSVELYEDDSLLLQLDSLNSYGEMLMAHKRVPSAAGRTYRLRVWVEGFEAVESEVVAPAALTLAEYSVDTSRVLVKDKMWLSGNSMMSDLNGWANYSSYHPAKIGIVDVSTDRSYYQVGVSYRIMHYSLGLMDFGQLWVGTSNRLLVQDNPHVEKNGLLSDGESYDGFAFDQMVLSNYLFANKTCGEEFLVAALNNGYSKEELLSRGYAEEDLEQVEAVVNLSVKRITTELFKYYRAGVLQGDGLGGELFFFEEPVSVPSNITNGYGNFSITSSVYRELYRRTLWRHQQKYY